MRKYVTVDEIESIVCDRESQETCIIIPRDGGMAFIGTSDPTMLTKIKKLMEKNSEAWKCYEGSRDREGNMTGYNFEVPKKFVTFKSKTKAKRILTDEEKQEVTARFKRGKDARN